LARGLANELYLPPAGFKKIKKISQELWTRPGQKFQSRVLSLGWRRSPGGKRAAADQFGERAVVARNPS
jgi:hypothetical protein